MRERQYAAERGNITSVFGNGVKGMVLAQIAGA